MKTQVLKSRYKDVETILTSAVGNKAIIVSTGRYYRTGLTTDREAIAFVDFEGGPMISVGDTIQGKKVKSIRACHLIEVE